MIAASLLKERDARERIIPGLDDCDWTMLLILWADKRKLNTSNLCAGCHAPYTTALRHLMGLERRGLVERTQDTHDTRQTLVRLTDAASANLSAYAAAVERLAA